MNKMFLGFAVILLAGCASYSQKVAPVGGVPSQTRQSDGFEVAYSIARKKLVGLKGLLVVVNIKNTTHNAVDVAPMVLIFDSNKKIIGMGGINAVLGSASRQANIPLPQVFTNPNPNYSTFIGTARDVSNGKQYDITGTASSGSSFSSGFSVGASIGAAMAASDGRAEGRETMAWVESRWLRGSYLIPPGVTVEGELFMPFLDATTMDQNSLLTIFINNREEFNFALPTSLFN